MGKIERPKGSNFTRLLGEANRKMPEFQHGAEGFAPTKVLK